MPTSNKQNSLTVIATAAVAPYRFVDVAGMHASPGEDIVGTSEAAAAVGRAVSVVTGFSGLVESGGVIAAGDIVGPASDGTGRAVASGCAGRALSAATAAGQLVEVEIFRGTGLAAGRALVSGAGSNSAYILGDSLAANSYVTTSNTFFSLGAEGFFTHANNLLGAPFNFIGSGAIGGKTAAQVLTEQVPGAVASGARYAFVSIGTNDINAEGVNGQVCAERMIAVIEALQDGGMIPVWSTITARTFGTTARLNAMLECNDRLRRYAYLTRNPGIFWDAWRHTVDNTSTQCDARAGLWYDSAPNLHPNNVGGYYLGKALAATLRPLIKFPPVPGYGAEDLTNAPNRLSNLLTNPYFTGAGGTPGTGVSGTIPTGWTVDWATRTGAGTLVSSIVDVTDPLSGLPTAKAIQLVIGGIAAANDVIRITQATGINGSLSGGDLVSAECDLTLASPTLITVAAMRIQTNTSESSWNGNSNQTASAYPEGFTARMRTRDMAVLGAGGASQARFDIRLTCSGASTGTVLMSLPRVRKGAV